MRVRLALAFLLASCGGARSKAAVEQVVIEPHPAPPAPPPPPRTEAALGEIAVQANADTPTPDAELRGQIVSWANGTRGCWFEGGRFALDFVIGMNGSVTDARVDSNDKAAADCARNRLVAWRFPEAQPNTHVTVTIFARGEGGAERTFDRGTAAAALGAILVRTCATAGGPTGAGRVSVTFDPSGAVSDATIDAPPFAGTPVGACVENKFRTARVPPFDGPPVKVGKSFMIP